jgi:hypothetical protein
MSERKKEVPKLLSMISNKAAESKTGKETTPITAVIKKAQMVKGKRLMVIPLVRRFNTVTI